THLKSRDLSTQQEEFILNKTGRVAFSPGGEVMAVKPDYENTLMLIDPKTTEEKRRIKVSGGLVWETVFSLDGKMLADKIERGFPSSIGGLPVVQVWEVETGKELLTLDRRSHPIFLRDGRTLLTRNQGENIFEDGMKLELWDIKTGQELG